jgi:hypothetical protein
VRTATAFQIQLSREHGSPVQIVNAALGHVDDDEVDQVWCVFDVEWPQAHPSLGEAVAVAESGGVLLAISNPCFELWLELHHQDVWGFQSTDESVRARAALDGADGKGLGAFDYPAARWDAVRRARLLEDRHAEDRKVSPADNPSSGVFRLIEAIGPAPAS